ncbi:MAG: hypothetical protein JWM56_1331 [Candidatus Peribacteria bacterium]|nr:hypothetical protein [Candidatus Peribacteria bacterium]
MSPPASQPAVLTEGNSRVPLLRTTILRRIVRESVLVSAAAIVVVSLLSIVVVQSLLSERTLSQLSSVATARKDILEVTIQHDRERTAFTAASPELHALVQNWDPDSALLLLNSLRSQNSAVIGMSVFSPNHTLLGFTGVASVPFTGTLTATKVVPSLDRLGSWNGYDMYSPVYADGSVFIGYVAIYYDVAPLLTSVFGNLGLGESADIVLGRQLNGSVSVLHHYQEKNQTRVFSSVVADVLSPEGALLKKAVTGGEGAVDVRNADGIALLAAYRSIPSLGWGMVVSVQKSEILSGVQYFAVDLLIVSTLLILFSAIIGYLLAKSLTSPLKSLSSSLSALMPGHWTFARSVHTGDEVEMLDYIIADLTSRLKKTYDHLEELVAERTQALNKEYALDRAILESIEYGVMTLDAAGLITDVNPAFLTLLGYARQECVGRQGIEVLQLSQKKAIFTADTHPVTQCLSSLRSFRSSASMHLSMLKKNQTLLPVLLMVTPLMEEKTLLGAIVIFQDMTEDRQIDYMKSEFITLASHQLRTPLSAVRWNLELFNEAGATLDESHKEYMTEIEQSSRRMAKVLDELLHAARLEEGGYAYEKQKVKIVAEIKRIADENSILTEAAGMHMSVQLPATDIDVSTDPILLEIVLQNLVANAIKYSPKGSSISFVAEVLADRVEVRVTDAGMGIPVSEQKRVFEKFFRAHNVRQTDTDGTGLGLYISKRAIESLGGGISFVSEEGKGTTFTVNMPLI